MANQRTATMGAAPRLGLTRHSNLASLHGAKFRATNPVLAEPADLETPPIGSSDEESAPETGQGTSRSRRRSSMEHGKANVRPKSSRRQIAAPDRQVAAERPEWDLGPNVKRRKTQKTFGGQRRAGLLSGSTLSRPQDAKSTSPETVRIRPQFKKPERGSLNVRNNDEYIILSDSFTNALERVACDEDENAVPSHSSTATTTSPGNDFSSPIKGSQSTAMSTPPASPTHARCPMCQEVVDRIWLEGVATAKRMTIRQQARICRAHQKKSADESWGSQGYPRIDWDTLDKRLAAYDARLQAVIENKRPSYYRNTLQALHDTGTSRTLRQAIYNGQNIEGFSPGYYGPRGAKLLNDHLMTTFVRQLRELAQSDRLVLAAGISGYVQAVLVPELATCLVMDDLQLDEDAAHQTLRDSAKAGELVHGEDN